MPSPRIELAPSLPKPSVFAVTITLPPHPVGSEATKTPSLPLPIPHGLLKGKKKIAVLGF